MSRRDEPRALGLPAGEWSCRRIEPQDPEWPAPLAEIPDAPEAIYVDGEPLGLAPAAVAVVGTRRPTSAGLEAARAFAAGLAQAGFVVVSGLAVGIDAAAHSAALDAGGRTIAVLGCGLDVDYPTRNRGLRRGIRASGSLVTEFPPGTPPAPFHFPRRNRIIAGLCAAVVVVEGGARSGALITARLALDANRAVFAVPGSIRNPMAEAPNRMLAEGLAAAAPDVAVVLDDLAPALVYPATPTSQAAEVALSDPERAVLELLDDAPVPLESLARNTGLEPGALGLGLSKLEVRGLAVRRPGGYEITSRGARVRAALDDDGEAP
jgi:DNA processing protein